MNGTIDVQTLFSGLSLVITAYFWLVKTRRERPNLDFYQLSEFRMSCRRHPDKEGLKRLCIQQLATGGVLIVNHSTRQNSVVLFNCFMKTSRGTLQGDWGYTGEDKPPWNVGPESTIAFSPACFFDVPEDFEVPDNPEFHIQFITASGTKFTHAFTRHAPSYRDVAEPRKKAA